jgi:hypothetical protein
MSLPGEEESIMIMLPKDGELVSNNDGVWKSSSSTSFWQGLIIYLVDDFVKLTS